MSCAHCKAIEQVFDQKSVKEEFARYRRKGPGKTTRLLIEAIQNEGIEDQTLLDIGGGVGAIQYTLLENGVRSAAGVEASRAYLQIVQGEVERRNLSDRVSLRHGDFVELAGEVEPADIVTLDRVICCYPNMVQLVGLSVEKAKRIYGLVYPRDTWWMRLAEVVENLYFQLSRSPFRFFVHSSQSVEAILSRNGFNRRFHHQGLSWQVAVYTRSSTQRSSE